MIAAAAADKPVRAEVRQHIYVATVPRHCNDPGHLPGCS